MATPNRGCSGINEGGTPCGATAMRGSPFCFFHSPDTTEEAAEARRLGGLRRRREATVAGAYEFEGLSQVSDLRRVLEIAAVDALSLENSVARSRVLIAVVQAGARLLEVGELDERLDSLEAAVGPRLAGRRS